VKKNSINVALFVACTFMFLAFLGSCTGPKTYVKTDIDFNNILSPVQKNLSDNEQKDIKAGRLKCTIVKKAHYDAVGKVVAKSKPRDFLRDFMSHDIGLAWGKLPNKSKDIGFFQRGRGLGGKNNAGFSVNYVLTHSSNKHLVAANKNALKDIEKIRVGDFVRIEGYLIDFHCKSKNKEEKGTTSMMRGGAEKTKCEIIYTEKVSFLKK
jgi:hypothetical protein